MFCRAYAHIQFTCASTNRLDQFAIDHYLTLFHILLMSFCSQYVNSNEQESKKSKKKQNYAIKPFRNNSLQPKINKLLRLRKSTVLYVFNDEIFAALQVGCFYCRLGWCGAVRFCANMNMTHAKQKTLADLWFIFNCI